MANVRDRINRMKIEHWRTAWPIVSSVTIYQGDMLCVNTTSKNAYPAVAASGAEFIGISDTTNPIETIGSTRFLSDSAYAYVNVIQSGLVELISDVNATLRPCDALYIGTDAQHVTNSGSNSVGFVDPKWASPAGKTVAIGDMIRLWIKVPTKYNVHN